MEVQEALLHWEGTYIRSIESQEKEKPQGWIDEAIGYWKSLDDRVKKSFLLVNTSDLDCFSCEYLNIPSPRYLLADVVAFRQLYNQWDVYICPSPGCLRWFVIRDFLFVHLACEHLQGFDQTNAWPLEWDLADHNWCVKTLRKTVWKPIDVERAFGFLFDACGCSHHGGSLFNNLPLSEDSRRSELLEKLRKGFEKLIEHQEKSFFSMLSNGRLRALIHLAAKHIVYPTSSISLTYPFRSLLEHLPICFCFLEEEPLSCFVQLVDDMVHFVNQVKAAPPNGIMDLSTSNVFRSKNGNCLAALTGPLRNGSQYYFELDEDEIECQPSDPGGLPRWVFEAPCIPSIELVPAKASEMFHLVESKVKSFVNRLTISNMQPAPTEVVYFELWSAMCRTYESVVDSPPSLLSTEELNLWNGESARGHLNHRFFSCSPPEELVEFRRTAFRFKIEPGYLELIKLSFELQCLKPQIEELCKLDLRKCILPLLRSYLRMKLYAYVNMYHYEPVEDMYRYEPVEDTDVQISTDNRYVKWTEEVGERLTECSDELSDETDEDCRDISVTDTRYEDESASVPSWVKDNTNRSLYLFLSESGLLETEFTGLLVWGSITDVINDCVQTGCLSVALQIWERKTYRSLKYWCSCCRELEFPYRERHMEHMERVHKLGFPPNAYWLMPMPNKQYEVKGELGLELEKASSGSTGNWDGSVTFDRNYNCFLVDAAKLSQMPSNNGEFRDDASLSDKFRNIQDQLSILKNLFDKKCKLLRMHNSVFSKQKLEMDTEIVQSCDRIDNLKLEHSECGLSEYNIFSPIGSVTPEARFSINSVNQIGLPACEMCELKMDTEILQCCARIDNLKQELSDCCLSEYNISSPIGSFIKARFGIKSVNQLGLPVRERFEALLRSVTCSNDFPSIKLELESPGKVLIKIKEHGGQFGFAYVGMSWKINGEMSSIDGTKRAVSGSFQMVASRDWESDYFLTDENMTFNVCGVNYDEHCKWVVQGTLRGEVIDKLCEFEAEFPRRS